MVLTDMPDAVDIEQQLLLSGSLEALFDRMLAAMAESRATSYLASLCPGRPPSGQIGAEHLSLLATMARHHIALVAPKRLWLMGKSASCAILGMSDAEARGRLHTLNIGGAMLPTIATAHPRLFEGSPSRKSAAWAEMQRLLI